MRVLFVSSEIFPLAKTGGLADVSAALPIALATLGVDVSLLMPGYPGALDGATNQHVVAEFPSMAGYGSSRLIAGQMPDSGLPVFLVDCPDLYEREGGPYQDKGGQDWPDNFVRFAHLSQVGAALAQGDILPEWRADVVHGNDWQAGLLPALLARRQSPGPKTVFTIHNMAFQGIFPSANFDILGLQPDILNADDLEYFGRISLLKAGIKYGDRLTTVSPSYAAEILTPAFGCGLDGLLLERAEDLIGILNGVDQHVWDPATDPHLSAWFDHTDLSGKHRCKSALQAELGLDADSSMPLVVYASRLTDQKMADLVLQAIPGIVAMGGQFALIGEGDRGIESALRAVGQAYPGRVAINLGYRESLAHRHYAGGDIILAPARFEPCGLVPMYGMLYGALPVVRRVGGMADTVVDATPESIRMGTATGFTFDAPSLDQMLACLKRAFSTFRDEIAWRRIMQTGMGQPWGWERPAQYYNALYSELAEVSAGVVGARRPAATKALGSQSVDESALVGT